VNGPRATIRVGVADKSPIIQAALKQLLNDDQRFELLLMRADGDSFLEAVRTIRIDVGVSGWVIAPGTGKYILNQMNHYADPPRIVVYSGAENSLVPAQVMAHGGAAFVSKSEQPEILLDTIAAVADGKMVFPFLDVRAIHQPPLARLTRRELDVLSALAAGHSNKKIAAEEGISTNTIKYHLKNIYQKLDVNTRSQAVAVYLKS